MSEQLAVQTLFAGYVKGDVAVSLERRGEMTYVKILQIEREAKR